MAKVFGRPFLEILLRQLSRYGFRHVILAAGYRADQIQNHFGDTAFGLRLSYSVEASPLGTGGALVQAAGLAESSSVLVMNGDSYVDADLRRFADSFQKRLADLSLMVVPSDGRTDAGTVVLDQNGMLTGFEEKKMEVATSCYLNAGVYLIERRMLGDIPAGREISLEREIFPQWSQQGVRIAAYVHHGQCVDIGTPERFSIAQELLRDVESQESVTQ